MADLRTYRMNEIAMPENVVREGESILSIAEL